MNKKRKCEHVNNTLDSLCDIFSFYSEFDSSISRQTCRWWNDLLTKDAVSIIQIENNTEYIGSYADEPTRKKYSVLRINQASTLGYLKILKWSIKNGCMWNKWICFRASAKGHLNLLKWIISQETYKNLVLNLVHPISDNAVCNDQLKLLKYIRTYIVHEDFRSVWYSSICSFAFLCNKFEIFRWCILNGARIRNYFCAASQTKPEIRNYIHSLPFNDSPCQCPRMHSIP
jgi:hypothetical protein